MHPTAVIAEPQLLKKLLAAESGSPKRYFALRNQLVWVRLKKRFGERRAATYCCPLKAQHWSYYSSKCDGQNAAVRCSLARAAILCVTASQQERWPARKMIGLLNEWMDGWLNFHLSEALGKARLWASLWISATLNMTKPTSQGSLISQSYIIASASASASLRWMSVLCLSLD